MSKQQYYFFLSENEMDYLKEYKDIKKCSSQNKALENIIKEHEEFSIKKREKEIEVDKLADIICKNIIERVREEI